MGAWVTTSVLVAILLFVTITTIAQPLEEEDGPMGSKWVLAQRPCSNLGNKGCQCEQQDSTFGATFPDPNSIVCQCDHRNQVKIRFFTWPQSFCPFL